MFLIEPWERNYGPPRLSRKLEAVPILEAT